MTYPLSKSNNCLLVQRSLEVGEMPSAQKHVLLIKRGKTSSRHGSPKHSSFEEGDGLHISGIPPRLDAHLASLLADTRHLKSELGMSYVLSKLH